MTHKTHDSLSTETLTELAEELEQKLLDIPIYRDLLAVRKMLAERNAPIKLAEKGVTSNTFYTPRVVRLGRITAIGAALRALTEAGRPMHIHELVEAVQRFGFKFGGKKAPASALAAYFAKPGPKSPIVSIWIDNTPMWWFRDQPVPGAEVA
jgi:hypothetical protein